MEIFRRGEWGGVILEVKLWKFREVVGLMKNSLRGGV